MHRYVLGLKKFSQIVVLISAIFRRIIKIFKLCEIKINKIVPKMMMIRNDINSIR